MLFIDDWETLCMWPTEGADEEPNDTYVEQLVASAQAAVDELVRRGVADPQRIAVGGHSYGGRAVLSVKWAYMAVPRLCLIDGDSPVQQSRLCPAP